MLVILLKIGLYLWDLREQREREISQLIGSCDLVLVISLSLSNETMPQAHSLYQYGGHSQFSFRGWGRGHSSVFLD